MAKEFLDLSKYHNIIVCTGAGISVGCGVQPYRTSGGMLDQIKDKWGSQYPELRHQDKAILALSRRFHQAHPEFSHEFGLWFARQFNDLKPGPVHRLCAHLASIGKLVRVYTQNVDGLHDHPSLDSTIQDKVVNFHGRLESIVMYGDPIPDSCYDTVLDDFQKADLVLVVGTSLQVQPFCLLPNLARNGATRVLVNRPLQDCFANSGRSTGYRWLSNICQVKSGNLWKSRQAKLVWNELFWDDDCDVFATKMLNQLKETSSSSSSTSTK